MSDKKRKTFSIDEDNAELCSELDNASAVVDDLLTQYRQSENRHTAALDMKIGHKENEIEETKRKLSRLEQELDDLERLRAEFTKQEDAELDKAQEELEGVPREVNNPAIQNWADNLGLTPTELIGELDT